MKVNLPSYRALECLFVAAVDRVYPERADVLKLGKCDLHLPHPISELLVAGEHGEELLPGRVVIRRDQNQRYAVQVLGPLWAVLDPRLDAGDPKGRLVDKPQDLGV
jgi:hypothetical protein